MSDLGTLLLGALALKAFGEKSEQKVPDPPPQPDQGAGGGGVDPGQVGELAGSAVAGLLGLIGGGGGIGTSSGGAVATTTAAGAGTATSGGAVGTAATASVSVIGFGGAMVLGWAALFVLQFVAMSLVNSARTQWLRYRDSVLDANMMPWRHLHFIERRLVADVCGVLRLPYAEEQADDRGVPAPHGLPESVYGEDPRLTVVKQYSDGFNRETAIFRHWRQIVPNPFAQGEGINATTAGLQWRFVQLAARLVAYRYAEDVGAFARGMLSSFPGLGGNPATAWGASSASVWSYPLLGGGVPSKSYDQVLADVRALGPARDGTTIDDILNFARLTALLYVASMISMDSQWRSEGADWYSAQLYNALGVSESKHRIKLDGYVWYIDPGFYRVPCKALWLDVHELKGGLPLSPFLPGAAVLLPQPFHVTSLRARI